MDKIYSTSKNGHLQISGADTVALAQKYSTPLYVMSEDAIRQNCQKVAQSIEKYYCKGMPLYASKAFCCKEIYRLVNSEGFGADVVSGGELYTALQAGFPAQNIYFHGNNKTPQELAMAVREGVGHIVVDNNQELEILDSIAAAANKKVNILFRLKPGIDAHTHKYVRTGQIDSKFGYAIETGEAENAFFAALKCKNLILDGIHCHIGSQILDIEPFCDAAIVMLNFALKMKEKTGITISVLNLGGGFGIRYVCEDDPKSLDSYIKALANTINQFCEKTSFPKPFLCVEPGRSIVGDAGLTLYTVGSVKNIPDCRTYVSVDGGMTDNPRYALYASKYEMLLANKADKPKDFTATIAGRCCESGDLLGENVLIQTPKSGDILAVLATGAYNYVMASNYNRVPRLPTIFIKNGEDKVVIRRESYEDLVQNDV